MKVLTPICLIALTTPLVSAHAIFQKVSVNGVEQALLYGVRAPDSNYPITSVSDANFACNTGITHKDNNKIVIPAGATVGGWWEHVIGGPQVAGDPDNPIADSHKGPIIAYLASVSDAATTGTAGLSWFKVSEDGLSNGAWAVDRMIANQGWHYFTMPSCIAPGDYLLRLELIALHNAYNSGGAQFYMECAQITVTGTTGTGTGSETLVSFPGAYSSSDPGILINIYGTGGSPDNNGKPYAIPGPPVLTCGANSATTTVATTFTTSKTSTTSSSTTTSATTSATGAPQYGQCGGQSWKGPTTCVAPYTCQVSNAYYSQCL